MNIPRTLVLLDIDGVVNADRPEWPHESWRDEDLYVDRLHQAIHVQWSTEVTDRLRLIAESSAVTMRWCTTWTNLAPTLFAPAIGLGVDWAFEPETKPTMGAFDWWKAAAARRALSEYERVVWIDDDIRAWQRTEAYLGKTAGLAWMNDERLLWICPNSDRGLERHHFERIERFIA